MIPTVRPNEPDRNRLAGIRAIARPVHQDPRGFLVETLRSDDAGVAGDRFAMSYTSVTIPGEFRDRDRWHLHRRQTDRFVVPIGEMILALLDDRPGSATRGNLEVIRLAGVPYDAASSPAAHTVPAALVPIPPGVLHCIGNLSDRPFVLQNFPTELYDPSDEFRVPFAEARIASLGGTFSWERVDRAPAGGGA